MSNGQFVVCHGQLDGKLHRVCRLGPDGQVVKSFGGSSGSGSQEMLSPIHLAVDRDGLVFVADEGKKRVLLLSQSLTYICKIFSHRDQLLGFLVRLCLDEEKSLLYVAANDGVVGMLWL